MLGDVGDPEARGGGLRHELIVVQRERPRDVDVPRPAFALEFPPKDSRPLRAVADALVLAQVIGRLRRPALLEVPGRRDRDEARVSPEAHGDHVLRHGLLQAYSGVEALDDDVDKAILRNEIDLHLGVAMEEHRENARQQ